MTGTNFSRDDVVRQVMLAEGRIRPFIRATPLEPAPARTLARVLSGSHLALPDLAQLLSGG